MCGIFCSFQKEEIEFLAGKNSYRGSHSFSILSFHENQINCTKQLGKFNIDLVAEEGYKICHIQAPTTSSKSAEFIHPAQIENNYLWHNGIIKHFDCLRLNRKQNNNIHWDTHLLLLELLDEENRLNNLSEINGSFACVFLRENQVFFFRNILSPLFYGKSTFSSVKTSLTPKIIPSEKFLRFDFSKNELIGEGKFLTKEQPYYGLEHL